VYHIVLFDGLVFDETGAKIAPVKAEKEGQRLPPKRGKDCPGEGGKFTQKEGQSTADGIERARVHLEPVLNQQSLSHIERELLVKDLKRIFPSITTIPHSIPIEKAFLFWYKVRVGDIQSSSIRSPVGYMSKMLDEDINAVMKNDSVRVSRMIKSLQSAAAGGQ